MLARKTAVELKVVFEKQVHSLRSVLAMVVELKLVALLVVH